MSTSEKDVSDQSVKEKTNELRSKYPIFIADPGKDSGHGSKRRR